GGQMKYVHSFTDTRGKRRHYFRHQGKKWPLPAPGTDEFAAVYDELLADVTATPRRANPHITHGKSKSATYGVWARMMKRCNNPHSPSWKDYGGRGISVCRRWYSFAAFYEDMGDKPQGLSLNRMDNDGNYAPGNCCWATNAEQATNRREREHN